MISHSKPTLEDADRRAVLACIDEGMISEGHRAEQLLTSLRQWFGGVDGLLSGSGSQALELALRVLQSDRQYSSGRHTVVMPTYVCAEVLGVVHHLGLTARLVDIDSSYQIDLDRARESVDETTLAVVIPHLFGGYRDPSPLHDLSVAVIEDFAQRLASPGWPQHGDWHGDLAIFSFEATKMLTAGEGGAVVAGPDWSGRLTAMKRFHNEKLNLWPLSDLQAALMQAQLDRADSFIIRRRRLAERYRSGLKMIAGLSLPNGSGPDNVCFRFPVLLDPIAAPGVDAVIRDLAEKGIAVRKPVNQLLHRLEPYPGMFPIAERLFEQTISLPLYPSLTDEQCDLICNALRRVLDTHSRSIKRDGSSNA